MKFLVIYDIKEGRWHKEYSIEYNTYEEMLEGINNLSYGWKVKKVYEIAQQIEI